MGEVTDAVLSGFLCQQCGQVVDFDTVGYPRNCEDCDS